MTQPPPAGSHLLLTGEVAAMLRIGPATVIRRANEKLRSTRTIGRHRRYYRAEVEALMRGEVLDEAVLDAIAAAVRE